MTGLQKASHSEGKNLENPQVTFCGNMATMPPILTRKGGLNSMRKDFLESLSETDSQGLLRGSQQTVENSERDENIGPPYLSPEKPAYRSRSNI